MLAADCSSEYTLAEVNIESDPELLHLFRNDIPVVLINEAEAFRHRVVTVDFRRRVTEAANSSGETESP